MLISPNFLFLFLINSKVWVFFYIINRLFEILRNKIFHFSNFCTIIMMFFLMISRSIFRNSKAYFRSSNIKFSGCIFIPAFKISPVTLIFGALASNFTPVFDGSTTTLSFDWAAFAAPLGFTPFDDFCFFVSRRSSWCWSRYFGFYMWRFCMYIYSWWSM